jgi:hypothetical protein
MPGSPALLSLRRIWLNRFPNPSLNPLAKNDDSLVAAVNPRLNDFFEPFGRPCVKKTFVRRDKSSGGSLCTTGCYRPMFCRSCQSSV